MEKSNYVSQLKDEDIKEFLNKCDFQLIRDKIVNKKINRDDKDTIFVICERKNDSVPYFQNIFSTEERAHFLVLHDFYLSTYFENRNKITRDEGQKMAKAYYEVMSNKFGKNYEQDFSKYVEDKKSAKNETPGM